MNTPVSLRFLENLLKTLSYDLKRWKKLKNDWDEHFKIFDFWTKT